MNRVDNQRTQLFSLIYPKVGMFSCLLMLLLCQSMLAHAHQPIRIYEMGSTSESDVLFSYDEGKIFFGSENKAERMIYRFHGNKLYRVLYVNARFKETCLYTFTKHRIYRGDSTERKDCLFTFHNGKIYNSYDTTRDNTLYRFNGTHVFRGHSHKTRDILYTFQHQSIFRGVQTTEPLYRFKAKNGHWHRVYYSGSKQPVFTFTPLSAESTRYPCSRMKYIRMLGLIDFLSLGLIDSPWSMIYFALQMNDAVYQCID